MSQSMTESSAAAPARNALPWLGLSVVLIALDQWTKQLALTLLEGRGSVEWIPGYWSWTLTMNPGASFSMGANSGQLGRIFFIVLAVGISGLLVHWLRGIARNDWRTALPFALIIAGAIGNVIDRVRFGKVVDFIDWHYHDLHWPVFNVADCCIVVGAVLMVLFSLRQRKTGG
jgi:signal peptidase II